MEKYSQFRDKGTAIAPFLPVPTPPSGWIWTPVHLILFFIRFPLIIFCLVVNFTLLEWLPVGAWIRKGGIGCLMAIPGIWWIDLQVDGVKRGNLYKSKDHLPAPGTVIASSLTSPLDPLYLAGVFCPIFTRSYPATRQVEQISLLQAILLAFSDPATSPPDNASLTTLAEIQQRNPRSIITVFPECTTTNGRGILPFSPSLLTADPKTKIYPISLRYTPADITTPIPGHLFAWIWRLCSNPTHCIRVRIAQYVYNNPTLTSPESWKEVRSKNVGFDTNIFDSPHLRNGFKADSGAEAEDKEDGNILPEEQKVLDRVGEDLARLGRVKRVGLGVQEKIDFVKLWRKRRR